LTSGVEFYKLLLANFKDSSNKFAFLGWKSFFTPFSSEIECAVLASFDDNYAHIDSCYNAFIVEFTKELVEKWTEIVAMIKGHEGQMPLTLKENYFTVPIGFEFSSQFSPFFKTGNEIIGWLLNGGILQYWHKLEMVKTIEEDAAGPKVLLFNDLSFGFVLWLAACLISTTGYMLEILWLFFKRLFHKNLKFLMIFLALRLRLNLFLNLNFY
jgi:hypothetical protein